MVSAPEFFELVRKMREHQKAYFKTKSPLSLRAAKDYERRVDLELDPKPRPPMFRQENER